MDYGFLADMVGLELHKAQKMAEKKYELTVGGKLQYGQLTILELIEHNPGQTQSAIAKAVGLDRSSLVPILKQFEKKKLIIRRKAQGDGRSNIIELTQEGEAVIAEFKPTVTELENSVADALGKDDYQQFVQLLKKFQRVVTN